MDRRFRQAAGPARVEPAQNSPIEINPGTRKKHRSLVGAFMVPGLCRMHVSPGLTYIQATCPTPPALSSIKVFSPAFAAQLSTARPTSLILSYHEAARKRMEPCRTVKRSRCRGTTETLVPSCSGCPKRQPYYAALSTASNHVRSDHHLPGRLQDTQSSSAGGAIAADRPSQLGWTSEPPWQGRSVGRKPSFVDSLTQ
jgi:hypothetical protein